MGYDKLLLHKQVIFVKAVTEMRERERERERERRRRRRKEKKRKEKRKPEELVWVDLFLSKLSTKYTLPETRISIVHSLLAHNYSHHSAFSALHFVITTVILRCQRVTKKRPGQCDGSNITVQLFSQMRKKQ